MEKVVSAAVIIENSKGQILALHPTGKAFKSPDGSPAKGCFDLPKGQIDGGELPEEAAIREVKEETGLTISNPKYLGRFDYTKNKDLEIFHIKKNVNLKTLKCESFFENRDGKILPEVNGYSLIDPKTQIDWLYPSLQKVVLKALND